MIRVRSIRQLQYSHSQRSIKTGNTTLLLNTIRDRMPIARSELARLVGLSPSTVSNLVDDLLREGWILESSVGETGLRGRRKTMLTLNAQRGYICTIELLSRGYICTIYNICLRKIRGVRIRNSACSAALMSETIQNLLRECGISPMLLMGIHLIFPGFVDPVSGDLIRSLIIPDEELVDRQPVAQLQKLYPHSRVLASSNGTIIAFEEFISKESNSMLPLLSLNIDEAIFGGIVMGDEDDNLHFCLPLELGHMIIDRDGPLCKCGNRGCLETMCATPVLFRALNENAGLSLPWSEGFGADVNVSSMQEAARELAAGNEAVAAEIRKYCLTLAGALRSAVNLFGIRQIRIGGDIALLGDPFLSILRRTFSEESKPLDDTHPTQIGLFLSDYEQVRVAATIMCLDTFFRTQSGK